MSRPAKVNNQEITYLSNGYSLEVVRMNNVLADIDFVTQDDYDICKDIIFNLETKASEVLKEGKTISLPYIGRLRKPLVKTEYLKHRNLLYGLHHQILSCQKQNEQWLPISLRAKGKALPHYFFEFVSCSSCLATLVSFLLLECSRHAPSVGL